MSREPSTPPLRALLILFALTLGCTERTEGEAPEGKASPDDPAATKTKRTEAETPEGKAPPNDPAAPSANLCADFAQVAQLYPKDRLTRNDALRKRVLAVAWARHKSGVPHDVRGDDVKRWHRNTDLKFTEKAGMLEVEYRLEVGEEGQDSEFTEWTKTCDVCGDLLVCREGFSTLRVRDGDLNGTEMTWLDFNAYVPAGERSYYFQRFGHEVVVQFETDPMTATSGTAKVRMRSLDEGKAIAEGAPRFESEAYGIGDRKVRLELPNELGRLTFILRDTKDGHLEGSGPPKFVPEGTLFDIEKMQRHPMLRD